MPHEFLTMNELAVRLGRDRRELEKLVARGRIPGHKADGEWRFHPAELQHWLEQEMRTYSDEELAAVESLQNMHEVDVDVPVSSLLHPDLVQVPLEAKTRRSLLEGLMEVAGRTWQVWEPAVVLRAILEREEVLSTGFDNGAAIPHPRNPLPQSLGQSLVAFARTSNGILFGAPGHKKTDLFFLVLCRESRTHLQVLARLGRMFQTPGFLDSLRTAEDSAAAYQAICEADRKLGGR